MVDGCWKQPNPETSARSSTRQLKHRDWTKIKEYNPVRVKRKRLVISWSQWYRLPQGIRRHMEHSARCNNSQTSIGAIARQSKMPASTGMAANRKSTASWATGSIAPSARRSSRKYQDQAENEHHLRTRGQMPAMKSRLLSTTRMEGSRLRDLSRPTSSQQSSQICNNLWSFWSPSEAILKSVRLARARLLISILNLAISR